MTRGLVPLVLVALMALASPVSGLEPNGEQEPSMVVDIAFTGDTIIHLPISQRARTGDGYDFRSMFTQVAPILRSADLAICHLEVPLSPTSSPLSGFPNFNAPGEVADALAWAGYDGCSTASNHSFDQGVDGVAGTIAMLDRAGLNQAGMSATPEQGWTAAIYEARGLRLSHVSATYWLNGYSMPVGEEWYVQLLDKEQILGIAAREKRTGSDLVVVSIHCCVEYRHEPTPAQRELYRELIMSPDVDLVVSHHSHVVGPIEEVDGEYILHGLGNFISAQNFRPGVDDGIIVTASAVNEGQRWTFAGVEVVPTWVERGTYQILPALTFKKDSYLRTMSVVRMYGVDPPHQIWQRHPGYRLPRF